MIILILIRYFSNASLLIHALMLLYSKACYNLENVDWSNGIKLTLTMFSFVFLPILDSLFVLKLGSSNLLSLFKGGVIYLKTFCISTVVHLLNIK